MIKTVKPQLNSSGHWWHPELPIPEDGAEVMNQDVWEAFLDKHSIRAEIVKPSNAAVNSLSTWEPVHSNPSAVLLCIADSADGPAAWFAIPTESWHDRGGA